ncbi:MAG: sugar phosphate isomerase/epimerase family protein [Victivallaceae bacterium]
MTPSLFSVSYAGYWGQHRLSAVEFIAKAASLGYGAVQLAGKKPHLDFVAIGERELDAIAAAAAEHGVEIHTIAAYTDFTAAAQPPGTPFVDMQLAYLKSLAELGRRLGASQLRIFSGYCYNPDNYLDEWQTCVAAVRESASIAAGSGLKLGLQNHHDTAVGIDAYCEFLDEVDHPNCFAMFDPWAPALHGEDLYEAGRRLAPRMIQTTLADYVKLPRYRYLPGLVNYEAMTPMLRAVPLGEGCIDNAAFLRGLRDGGFDGYVVYEMCSPLRGGGSETNLDRAASLSLAAIKKLIA